MTPDRTPSPDDFIHILDTTLQGWTVIATHIPMERKDLPGTTGEWCFSPREEDLAGIRTLATHWDHLEEILLPALIHEKPLLAGEVKELLRIVRAKIFFNDRNHHFVGYTLASDPTGEGSRTRFSDSMERTIAHLKKRLGEVFSPGPPGTSPVKGTHH